MQSKTIYICGPMRGYKDFNFPAFDAARDKLLAIGYKVISPADLDRECGADPTKEWTEAELEACVRRDIEAVFKADWIVLLPGWENSIGANAEIALAKWIKKPIYSYSHLFP